MDRLFMDNTWVRINNETDNNGDASAPIHARNVRSSGGSIIGRIVRLSLTKYRLEMYSKGEFKDMGVYTSVESAFRGLSALLVD